MHEVNRNSEYLIRALIKEGKRDWVGKKLYGVYCDGMFRCSFREVLLYM